MNLREILPAALHPYEEHFRDIPFATLPGGVLMRAAYVQHRALDLHVNGVLDDATIEAAREQSWHHGWRRPWRRSEEGGDR